MLTTLILTTLLAADPTAEQVELLKTFRNEFVLITPGEGKFPTRFPFGENGEAEQEIAHAFWIAKYEVPQNLWQAVMGDNPSRWKGKRNSVEMVSFKDARDFCKQATQLMRIANLINADQVVRLPYEPEWTYVARAGTKTKYFFGDDPAQLGEYAWYTGNAAGNDPEVGAKKPNPWGLYDVHGYLSEWIDNQSGAADKRMLRGGSWKDKAEELMLHKLRLVDGALRDDAVGFRCVLTATKNKAQAAAKEFEPTAQEKIVPAESKLEVLWAEGEFTEGPALAPDGSILFSDIGNAIYRFDPTTKRTALFRKPSGRSNGLAFDGEGRLFACEGANTGGGRRISITTGIHGTQDGAVNTLADRFEGKRFNSPNDLAIDGKGNVYFTDPRYVGDDPRDLDFEAVFLVTPDGNVSIATREVQKPNGILVAPSGMQVYVADNNAQGNRHLLRFDVRENGKLIGKRIVHDFVSGRGIDGMTVDRGGNIYATAGTGGKAGVYVFGSLGHHLAFIPTPGDPTNCEFGGKEEPGMLYITAATGPKVDGKDPKFGLFRIRLNATWP